MKSRLILVQYREGSAYSDAIGLRYHFPRKYLNLMKLPNIEFIYYEPKKAGEGVYFGYGEVVKIEEDAQNADHFFAELGNYHAFPKLVPITDADGETIEASPYYNPQNAVRQVLSEIFDRICSEAGLELDSLGLENENPESEAIDTPLFDPSKIKVDRELLSVFEALRKLSFGEIQLNPDFQRNLVWDNVRQSRLIESALLRLPLPAFYFDGVDANLWTVIDGLQRLSTLNEYIAKKSFKLQGLEYLTAAEGKSFDQLSRGMQRDLEDTKLTIFIIRPDTPPEVKFTIFYRINTGGLVLTSQEIRHALFQGHATQMLKNLASSAEFSKATDGGVSDDRMDAREIILRYLAFSIQPYSEYRRSDLNSFLTLTMKKLNSMKVSQIQEIERSFLDAMNRSLQVFGRCAFRKFTINSTRRGPVNKALFESWANVLKDYDSNLLMNRKDQIKRLLATEFASNPEYARSLSAGTGSVASVKLRFEHAHAIVQKALR